jgi:hypothetical protein
MRIVVWIILALATIAGAVIAADYQAKESDDARLRRYEAIAGSPQYQLEVAEEHRAEAEAAWREPEAAEEQGSYCDRGLIHVFGLARDCAGAAPREQE